ncbi:Holliday junction branch migration protein RuvA [Candidatus Saccharibacteria bacterium]|nr:Holliday junction branch migration protein RuvA [Candidatus Saccharibacteria bacterium]
MIAHLIGTVAEKFMNSVIIDVSGVGYEVTVPTPDFEKLNLKDEVKLYTYHATAENSEKLYGFSTLTAKKLFELLISVNGVGPKAGIAIMSLNSAEEVRNAIANSDSAFVSKASGVGKKSAERIIVDLKDKVGLPSHSATTSSAPLSASDPALDALISLGFPLKEASAALSGLDPSLPVEERVKQALKQR